MGESHPLVATFLVDKAKLQLETGAEDGKLLACTCLSEADKILNSIGNPSKKGSDDIDRQKKNF